MADEIAAPTGKEVEVSVPVDVPNFRPLAANEARGVSGVVWDYVLGELVKDFLGR
jgi:hypothetical protein